mgnify:FL=1
MAIPVGGQNFLKTLFRSDTPAGKAFKYGIDQPTENTATTLDLLGYDDAAAGLQSLVPAPENYESAAARFMNLEGEGYNWKDLPLATVEQSGQLAGSMGLRAAGAGVGTLVGSPVLGAILAFGGPALFEAIQIAGPVALERAKNNGREEPNEEDWAGAMGTAGFSGVLNAIGVKGIPGLNSAVLGTTGKTIAQTTAAGLREGVTEGLQGVTEQVGGTALTDKGLTINPKQAIGEGLIGGTTGMVATGPAAVAQAVNSMSSTVDPTISSLIDSSASASDTLTADTVDTIQPLLLPLGEDQTISETAMASVPQSETYQDFNILDPILSVPEDLSQAKELFTREDVWPRLPTSLRESIYSESRYKETASELFSYLEGPIEKDLKTLSSVKKTNKIWGEELGSDDIDDYKPNQAFIQKNIITEDPGFKDKVKKEFLKEQFNLGDDRAENTTGLLTSDYGNKTWGNHHRLIRATNRVQYNEVASKYIAPFMQEQLNLIVAPEYQDLMVNDTTKEFAKNLLLRSKFDTNNPEFQALVKKVMGSINSFTINSSGQLNALTKEGQTDLRNSVQSLDQDINDLTKGKLFQAFAYPYAQRDLSTEGAFATYINDLEQESFNTELQNNNFFQEILEEAPRFSYGIPKEFTPRDIKRLEKQFYGEIKDHSEIYRSEEDPSKANFNESHDLMRSLLQNMAKAKEKISISSGLPKDVSERFSGHSKLKPLNEAEGPDTSVPVGASIGPLPSFIAPREELATAENGPLDPNFLTYSLSRSHLDKLRNKGIASLSGSEMLTYLSTPYKKLPENLKEISEAVPKKQQGEDAQDTAERINEIRDSSVRPYLESQGELPVSIEYIQKLIDDNASRFSISEARSWEDDELRHGSDYRISGPTEGYAEYTVNHIPLLKPEEQMIVDSNDIKAGKKILEDSPHVYTERDGTHNWSSNKWNLRGLGTVGWMRGSLRKFGDNKIGALLGESQSYWIQQTRKAMSKAKKGNFSPTKIFRSDFQEQQELDIQNASQPELEQLLFEYEGMLPEVENEFATVLATIGGEKTNQYPEGYFTAFLNNPGTKKKLLQNTLRDINRLYTEDQIVSTYDRSVYQIIASAPNFEQDSKNIIQTENPKIAEAFAEEIFQMQPFKLIDGTSFTKQKIKERLESKLRTQDKIFDKYELIQTVNDLNPEINLFTSQVEIETAFDKIGEVASRLIDNESVRDKMLNMQKNSLEKALQSSPVIQDYFDVLKVLPDETTIREFKNSLEMGDAVIQPDPPFRNKFNQMNLRAWIVQSMKDGLEFVLIPATKNGKEYLTVTQEQYGQGSAPMGNYVSMLKEGEKIAKEYGLPIQTVTIDVGGGKTGEVTAIDIRALYEIVTEGGFKGGYKKGGLVTKAQGAGYSMNLGNYGRNYK